MFSIPFVTNCLNNGNGNILIIIKFFICLNIGSLNKLFFIITGGNFINEINFNLSFEGIIRKVITYGTAIILAILFVKQIKNMNNK